MTFPNNAPQSQTETLTLEFDLHHPPAKVWRALTEPALLQRWLLPIVATKLEPGARFTLHADPQPGWDGIVHCRLLEIEPPSRLSYTWIVGEPDTGLDTVVTFTLTSTVQGTRLTIEQSGFKSDQKQALGGARYGWQMMTDRLIDLLDQPA